MNRNENLKNNLYKIKFIVIVALCLIGIAEVININSLDSTYTGFRWYKTIFWTTIFTLVILTTIYINSLVNKILVQSELLDNILKAMSDGVVVIDQKNEFVLFNKAAEEIIGSGPVKEDSSKWSKHFGVFYGDKKTPMPQEEFGIIKALKGITTENQEQYICNAQKPNGVFLNVNARPLTDEKGAVVAGVATFQNVTEKVKLIEELKKNERLFYGLFEFAPDAIVGVDEKGRINRINAQTEILFGYKRDELLGKEIEILIPERFRNKHVHYRSDYQKEPRVRPMGASGLSLMGLRSDGTEFPLAITLGPVQLDGKTLTLAVIRDISAQKNAEQMIKNLNAELQRKIVDVEYAYNELKAFSYSVSHDLRAPIRSMIAFTRGILDENQNTMSGEAIRKLNKVLAASERMGNLVDALLKLAQLSRKELKVQDVNIGDIAKNVLNEVSFEYPALKIQAKLLNSCQVKGDPDLLYALLKNLFSNAVKFSSKNEFVELEFGVSSDSGKATFFVKDHGIGFDMSFSKNLFQDFERLHGVGEFEGTGIGLSSARRIIEKHGGKIWANSQPNEGATFYFQI